MVDIVVASRGPCVCVCVCVCVCAPLTFDLIELWRRRLPWISPFADSQETGRGSDVENISAFDLFDSYLPQYKIAFAGGASGAMCCA